jgi:hypothetical protein
MRNVGIYKDIQKQILQIVNFNLFMNVSKIDMHGKTRNMKLFHEIIT